MAGYRTGPGGVAPGEWRARIGFGFVLGTLLCFLAHLDLLTQGPIRLDADARAVGRNLAMLLIAWALLSRLARARWKNEVQEDERDRAITARAGSGARIALIVMVIGIAVTLGFSPVERLGRATPMRGVQLLVLALTGSSLWDYGATARYYWRDRR